MVNFLGIIVVFVIFQTSVECSKYSKDLNQEWLGEEENPFRNNKVIQLWTKAKKRLSGPLLADLYADLRIQDKREMELKKILHDDMDKDGLKEAEVRLRFRNIVKKYGLLEQFKYVETEMSNDIPLDNDFEKMMEFGDKKLQKIWKKAIVAGFTDEELDKLKLEFWHQQMKIDEYNAVSDEINNVETNMNGISENSVEGIRKKADLKDKHKDMKSRHKAVKDGYLKLESIATNSKDLEFDDPRVYQLWAVARKSNMTQQELDSFRNELKHFEHRISKHEFMKDKVLMSKHELRGEIKDGEYPEKHKKLEETADNYGRKVKKLYADLKKQVDKAISRHTEL